MRKYVVLEVAKVLRYLPLRPLVYLNQILQLLVQAAFLRFYFASLLLSCFGWLGYFFRIILEIAAALFVILVANEAKDGLVERVRLPVQGHVVRSIACALLLILAIVVQRLLVLVP